MNLLNHRFVIARLFAFAAIATLALATSAQANILGFNNGSGWTSNGSVATFSGNSLTLTDNNGSEASSAVYGTAQSIAGPSNTGFIARFTYQASGAKQADGTAFFFQPSTGSVNALGNTGGALGYGGIATPSTAYEINLYNGHTQGTNFVTNGATGTYNDTTGAGINPTSGDPLQVVLNYNNLTSTLSETVTDLKTNAVYTDSYSINLTAQLETPTHLLAFSGGTGGATSTQVVSNFTFVNTPEPSSLILCGLGAVGLLVAARRRRKA